MVTSAEEAQTALDAANPGDEIVLAEGSYANFRVILSRNGTEEDPIVFRAEKGGAVTFTHNSGIQFRADHVVVDGFIFSSVPHMGVGSNVIAFENASHSKLVNCAFYRCGFEKWSHIIRIIGNSQNCEVAWCYLEDIIGQGIGVTGSGNNTNNHIHHNRINRTVSDGESNGQEPIQVGQNARTQGKTYNRTVVEYNLIENMDGDCDPELISNKSAGNIYRHNTFVGNRPGTNLTIRGGIDSLVEGNYFDGSGIRAYGSAHVIKGNYINNVEDGIIIPGGTGQGIDNSYAETFNCTIEANWISGSSGRGVRIGGGGPGGTFLHDILVRENVVLADTGLMFYQERSDYSGIEWNGNIGKGDAQLSNSYISTGVELGEPPATELPAPLTPDDVGPDWMRRKNWAHFPVEEDGKSVDTGSFIGWIDISLDPWIYNYALAVWLYLPESLVSPTGAWAYVPG
ncbi:MAG: chondroitinase-B domain-containing protein [Puniceicoccaceae bacterium]